MSSPELARSADRSSGVDLRVSVGTVRLKNPIIAASGTFGYGLEFAHLVDLNALGGIVVKGLSLAPMAGAPSPRMCETPSGMVNAIGLQNVGVRAFVADKLPELRKYDT
ncbi:MAG: dihydroorotate dehydrogenase, partial [Terracidiphilus sp.]